MQDDAFIQGSLTEGSDPVQLTSLSLDQHLFT